VHIERATGVRRETASAYQPITLSVQPIHTLLHVALILPPDHGLRGKCWNSEMREPTYLREDALFGVAAAH
jgi:hypothetical protein